MPILALSASPSELCNRSSSVLTTRDYVAPGALPVSLREHPVWGHLVTHEGSAYERDCKVADAHRYVNLPSSLITIPTAIVEHKFLCLLPSSRGRKMSSLGLARLQSIGNNTCL